jgi:hypothetical protein
MDELGCKYVSSRGLLKSCERRNRNPESSSRHIDADLLHGLQDYDVVHICSWLTTTIFITRYAPTITKKIIVVSNDSDFDSPIFEKPVGKGDEIAKKEILDFINSPYCVHWFTQNCTLFHPKVTAIPIGMDYHTFNQVCPNQRQEQILNDIKTCAPSWNNRNIKCYGNFHFTMDNKYYSHERYDCFNNVSKMICLYEKDRVSLDKTWINQSTCAFVLSPAGGGLDCHRTWEALILGCIPIVKRFNIPLENVYSDLPVLIVDSWEDVTEELLVATIADFSSRQFNYDKLMLKYWVDLIYSYKHKHNS